MEAVLRGAAIYLFLMIVFRIGGRRTLAEMTPFDVVLLLIIGEAASQALMGQDFSLTNAFIVIATLLLIEHGFALVKARSPAADRWLDGKPLVLVDNGEVFHERLKRSKLDIDDILEQARLRHGLANLSQVRYAVLERDGEISIVPAEGA